MNGDREKDLACLAEKNFHFTVTYQPGSRYQCCPQCSGLQAGGEADLPA